jgi:hypothetical protein
MTHEQQLTPISIGFFGTPSRTGEMPVLRAKRNSQDASEGAKRLGWST